LARRVGDGPGMVLSPSSDSLAYLRRMIHFHWHDTFLALFDRALAEWRAGNDDWATYYSEEDIEFLGTIGYQPREFFDFVEDCAAGEAVSPASALLVAAVRRDYFMIRQGGQTSETVFPASALPAKTDASVAGIPYFARILQKARLKLRGELDPDTMFGCGGDRAFLMACDVHPADFLRHVWAAGEDDTKIIALVTAGRQTAA
jgi:hypothetical protein